MLKELYDEQNVTFTENGAKAFASTGSACLDLFGVAGSLRKETEARMVGLFTRAYAEDKTLAMRTLFYARDVRGGLGERRLFRVLLSHAAVYYPESIGRNLALIPEYGRFDDCLELLGTPCERQLIELIRAQLEKDLDRMRRGESVSLLAKWLPSVNASSEASKRRAKTLAQRLGMSEKQYRTTLASLRRQIDILETRLCCRNYGFDYAKQPSKALFKYRSAFLRHDEDRYLAYLTAVRQGRANMNAACLYPYEIIEQCLEPKTTQERKTLDVTWNALPDFTDGRNAIAVVDGSGSMYGNVGSVPGGGTYKPISVAVSLGMYFAERNRGAFHNRFITFSERPRLVTIQGGDVYEKAQYCMTYNEVANTDLYQVFMLLLITAVKHRLPREDLPETVYVISDMEFDQGVNPDETVFRDAKDVFASYGYRLPNVVYWNVDSRREQFPVDRHEQGAALVSGCSPSIFRMAMSQNVTPESFMLSVLNGERYRRIVA